MPLYHESKTSILSTLYIEEGRHDIYKWGETRTSQRQGISGWIYTFKKMFIDKSILRSFLNNLTVILAFQLVLAGMFTFMCQKLDLHLDIDIALFVSPIVFPLAFSINADFQRRERVLEDLAMFKGALIILFFCHRDWQTAAGLSQDFLKAVTNKLKGLILNIKEYLLTEKESRRYFILTVIYEDFSDISQMNDRIRSSKLDSNTPLVTRLIHYHNLMFWAFERLRVIREYRSPRTIRSFTKVFIFLMPIILSPYYVHIGKSSGAAWGPYYIAIISSFVFGTLQGVQDVLDDPFDGISEDDINLGHLEDWTTQSILTNRTYTVGRFTVTTSLKTNETEEKKVSELIKVDVRDRPERASFRNKPFIPIRSILRRGSHKPERADQICEVDENDMDVLYPEMASRVHSMQKKGLTGSTTILPGYQIKDRAESDSTNGDNNSRKSFVLERSPSDIISARGRRRAYKKTVSFSTDCDMESSMDDSTDEQDSPSHVSLRLNDEAPLLRPRGDSYNRCLNEMYVREPDESLLPESLRDVFHELEHAPSTSRVRRKTSLRETSDLSPSLASVFTPPEITITESKPFGSSQAPSRTTSATLPPDSLNKLYEPESSPTEVVSGNEFEIPSAVSNTVTGNANPAFHSNCSPESSSETDILDRTGESDCQLQTPPTDAPPTSGKLKFSVKPTAQADQTGPVNVQLPTSRGFQIKDSTPLSKKDEKSPLPLTEPTGNTKTSQLCQPHTLESESTSPSATEIPPTTTRKSRFSVTRATPPEITKDTSRANGRIIASKPQSQDSFWDFTGESETGSPSKESSDQQVETEGHEVERSGKQTGQKDEFLNLSDEHIREVYI